MRSKKMKKSLFTTICAALVAILPAICNAQVDPRWKIHDLTRPAPPVIDSGTQSTQDSAGRPPSDALVLRDGKDLSKWAHTDGTAAKWKADNGYFHGVLVQDNVELTGPTGHHVRPPYKPGPEKLPLALQDHGHPVRYRNIWIRELKTQD